MKSQIKLETISGFDYSNYLRQKQISGIVKISKIDKISKEKDFKFYLYKLKYKIISILEKEYSREESGFLKAILLGNTFDLDNEIKENFKEASISHVLAISGMHISYIVLFLERILEETIKNIRVRYIIIILFLIIFSIFVGETNSVLRASITTCIVYFGKIILKKENFYSSFKIALLVLIISNPYNILSASMWLSFGGSIGIVLYSKLIEKKLLKKLNIISKKEPLKKLFFKIISISSVTIGAQIIVFPIMIYVFNTFSLNFLISNLLISELIGLILILGYLSIFFSILCFPEKLLLKLTINLTKVLASLPLTKVLLNTPKLINIVIYYVILLIILVFYKKKRIFLFRKLRKEKLKILIVSIFIFILLFGNIRISFKKSFEIHFLDVGQGDCCLIKTDDNKVILIDGGNGYDNSYDYGKNVLGPYLLDHGITKIDFIIVSHFDSDHCGGLFYIVQNFKISNIIIGKQYDKYPNLISFIEKQREKKINLIIVEAEKVISLGKNTKIEVLFPNVKNKITDNEINNNSLVIKMYYKDISILFTGDIEEKAEKALIELYGEKLNSNILKVAHHRFKNFFYFGVFKGCFS